MYLEAVTIKVCVELGGRSLYRYDARKRPMVSKQLNVVISNTARHA